MQSPTLEQYKHSGIIIDLPPEQTPPGFWTGGSNVQFYEGSSWRTGGVSEFTSTASPPIFTVGLPLVDTVWWVYCTTTAVYVTDGILTHNITPAGLTASEAGDWTACILNNVLVMNNTHNVPYYWTGDPGDDLLPLPGWPLAATCKAIRAYKYHLFALAITENSIYYPDLLWWSSGAEPNTVPQEWLPTPSNDAGDLQLADTPGNIIDGLALRDTFIVYKDSSSYIIQYVAGQLVFTSRKLSYSSGLQSRNCIAEANGLHYVFTGVDVVAHDGQNGKSVVDAKVKRALINSVDVARRQLCQVLIRHTNDQVWICLPEQGEQWLSRAYLINLLDGSIGIRELDGISYVARGIVPGQVADLTWDSDNNAWDTDPSQWAEAPYSMTEDSLLMCDAVNSRLLDVDRISTLAGSPITAFVERTGLPIGDPFSRKLVTRLVPRMTGEAGTTLQVRVGGQGFYADPITWSDPVDFTIGTDKSVTVTVEARLIAVNFSGTTPQPWKLDSYSLEWVNLGLY